VTSFCVFPKEGSIVINTMNYRVRLGNWGVGELGNWGVGELGSWGVGELGSWGVGELGGPWGPNETLLIHIYIYTYIYTHKSKHVVGAYRLITELIINLGY
jgi:hypothetical protein